MKKTIEDFNLENKRVIIRCDLNVPIKDGKITDDNRIKESLKTIKYAVEKNAKVIILSHLGRIKSEDDKLKNSLKPVAEKLSLFLDKQVMFVNDTRGVVLEEKISKMMPGDVLMLENTRFEDYPNKLESSNDIKLGKYWASLGDIFINDAFGTAHRAHASNVGIATNMPSGIGFLIEKEINFLSSILNNPKRPFVVILGGAKMNDKIKVVDELVKKADYVLLGGGIANTFLKALNYDIKNSVYDEESIKHCKELLSIYKDKIILPVDAYVSCSLEENKEVLYSTIDNVPDNMMMLDIGSNTINKFKTYINDSKTVFWNGPVGVSELKNFEYGTKALCEILANTTSNVVIGGGDSASAAIRFGYKDKFSHISTGGGASLEFIEGKVLPGIDAIDNK